MQESQAEIIQDQNLVSMENLYVVQAILKKKRTYDGIRYLIRWKDYPDEKDFTWQPLENLLSVQHMIDLFEQKIQEKKVKRNELIPENKQIKQGEQINQNNKVSPTDKAINKPQTQKQYNEVIHPKNLNNKQQKPALDSDYIKQKIVQKSNRNDQIVNKDYNQQKNRMWLGQKKIKDIHQINHKKIVQNGIKYKNIQKQGNKKLQKFRQYKFQKIAQNQTKGKHPEKQIYKKPQKSKQSALQSQNPGRSHAHKFGKIFNHLYKNGQLYYEVQILAAETGKVLKIEMLSSSRLKNECKSSMNDYLEKLIIQLQQSYKKS